jgi:hypothetical protein
MRLRVRRTVGRADSTGSAIVEGGMSANGSVGAGGKGEAAGAIASASTGVAAAALSVVTAACCVSPVAAPIIVSVLGASGAVWAAGLKPYSGWILGGAFLALAFGFWTTYRPRRDCATGEISRTQRNWSRVAKVSLWFGAACWMTGVLLTLLLPS